MTEYAQGQLYSILQGSDKIRDQTKTVFDSLISNLLTERTCFRMPKIHNIQKQENQYEVTQVSPSYVRNGVLRVSIIQLRRCSDKENLLKS